MTDMIGIHEAARDLLEARERLGPAVVERHDLWNVLAAILSDTERLTESAKGKAGAETACQLVDRWSAEWLGSGRSHWGDAIDWMTAREIARRIDDATLSTPRAVDQGAVDRVFADLEAEFGYGVSNGVYAILAHDSLPDPFERNAWAEWFFKPADAAFEKAESMGLIRSLAWPGKWSLTDLGRAASAEARERIAS